MTKSAPLAEGTVIMAEEQSSGRGQAQNKWISEPGMNLTFSILLAPVFVSPQYQFKLNIAISLAINDTLRDIIGEEVKIKWPNDIYYRNQKLGGILIENSVSGNSIKRAIVGIGLNVNQADFPGLVNATSIKNILGKSIDKMNLLKQVCAAVSNRYSDLGNGAHQVDEYLSFLLGMNEERWFMIDQEKIRGRIVGIDDIGRLIIDIGGKTRVLAIKEVSYVFD